MKVTRQNQKKVFLWCTGIFLLLILYASYDIASRTTFPGSKGQLKERLRDRFTVEDEHKNDEKEDAEDVALPVDSLPGGPEK